MKPRRLILLGTHTNLSRRNGTRSVSEEDAAYQGLISEILKYIQVRRWEWAGRGVGAVQFLRTNAPVGPAQWGIAVGPVTMMERGFDCECLEYTWVVTVLVEPEDGIVCVKKMIEIAVERVAGG